MTAFPIEELKVKLYHMSMLTLGIIKESRIAMMMGATTTTALPPLHLQQPGQLQLVPALPNHTIGMDPTTNQELLQGLNDLNNQIRYLRINYSCYSLNAP